MSSHMIRQIIKKTQQLALFEGKKQILMIPHCIDYYGKYCRSRLKQEVGLLCDHFSSWLTKLDHLTSRLSLSVNLVCSSVSRSQQLTDGY